MTTGTLAKSPAGNIEPVANLKRRQQAVYLRPQTDSETGGTVWIETLPLPADFASKELYLSKGFRLKSQGIPKAEIAPIQDAEREDMLAKIKALEEDNARLKEATKKHKKTRA